MGLLDNISDSVVKKITKKETIRLTIQQLTEIVKDEFIKGADDEFLGKVLKTAKGGGWVTKKKLASASGRYILHVGSWNRGYILGRRKQTYILDNTENKFYQLNKDGHWKKFYKAVKSEIQMEKVNRSRNK